MNKNNADERTAEKNKNFRNEFPSGAKEPLASNRQDSTFQGREDTVRGRNSMDTGMLDGIEAQAMQMLQQRPIVSLVGIMAAGYLADLWTTYRANSTAKSNDARTSTEQRLSSGPSNLPTSANLSNKSQVASNSH